MKLYLCRHAQAADASGKVSDADRPLTPQGIRKFQRAARGLAALEPGIQTILSSPLVRARQTAQLAAEALSSGSAATPVVAIAPSLAPLASPGASRTLSNRLLRRPGRLDIFLDGLRTIKEPGGGVMAVGHEPILSRWIGQLCFGHPGACQMKKGAVAAIDLDLSAGRGTLLYLLQPGQLRRLRAR